jgi:hypothetical protein
VGRFLKRLAGKLLNAVRAPGFIRSNVCHSRVGVPIEVSVDELFTVIAVNDIRLLFHRLSGKFDGVILAARDCDSSASTSEAMESRNREPL